MDVETPDRTLTQKPERVTRKRVEAGLRQGELADLVGITRGHMNRIERGHVAASPSVLVRLALALGCPAADLMPPEEVAA